MRWRFEPRRHTSLQASPYKFTYYITRWRQNFVYSRKYSTSVRESRLLFIRAFNAQKIDDYDSPIDVILQIVLISTSIFAFIASKCYITDTRNILTAIARAINTEAILAPRLPRVKRHRAMDVYILSLLENARKWYFRIYRKMWKVCIKSPQNVEMAWFRAFWMLVSI